MLWWLATGWTIGFGLPIGGQKNFLLLYLSASVVGPTHQCLLWEMAHFHGSTVVGAWGPITHPTLVLILRISRAITMRLLYANFVMSWSDLYLLHICGWFFMNSVFMYQHKKKIKDNKTVKSQEFTKKLCFFLSSNSYRERAKRAQLNILFQNITLLFF